MNGSDPPADTGEVGAMNAGSLDVDRGEGYAYRRCYLDEDVWEEEDGATVRRALGEACRDVSLFWTSCARRGSIRTPSAVFEVRPPDRDRR